MKHIYFFQSVEVMPMKTRSFMQVMKNQAPTFIARTTILTFTIVVTLSTGQPSDSYSYEPGGDFSKPAGKGVSIDAAPIERFSVSSGEVRSVLKQLSEYSGVDIVMGEKVQGKISLSVTHKTWREILAIICKISSLTAVREQSYIYIIPTVDYQAQMVSLAKTQDTVEKVSTLRREVVKLKNVQADEMQKSIAYLLSARGKVTVAQHTNSLIIFDTDQSIVAIKNTIRELDIETNQVAISCKIIQVGSSVIQEMGIQWAYFDKINGTDVTASHLPGPKVLGSALEKLTFGIISQDKLAFTLEYLFQTGKSEVIAQPQITTLDNKEAKISMGSKVPFNNRDEAFNTVVKYLDVSTGLTVTPHITEDKRVMLSLEPTKQTYDMIAGQAVVKEQTAKTSVVVTDGETVVIAGLTSNEVANSEEGIPVLKDIPLIGNLFKHSKKNLDKQDLIIFVTPHIINKKVESLTSASQPQRAEGK
jgi:type IV pilus assembly protein PilQ